MKVKGMPYDQYKMSIEARPLQVLYTKYNPCEVITQFPVVRPLGKVRQDRRPSSEKTHSQSSDIAAADKYMSNEAKDGNMKLTKKLELDKVGPKFRSETNIATLERENTAFPLLNLSRSQTFENKFKIAAARGNGTHDLATSRSQKSVDKKVVHLPLFRINLKTYTGESEVSRTVAKTRESLRKLMELHTNRMKHTITTANIKNYEFSAPKTSGQGTNRSSDPCSNSLLSKPFTAKPALKSLKGGREGSGVNMLSRQPTRLEGLDNRDHSTLNTLSLSRETPSLISRPVFSRLRTDMPFLDDEPDDSMLSVAMRPDTSLTLGSTIHHMDRVIKSPGSDELRELSEVLKNSDSHSQQAWPTMDEALRHSGPLRSHSRNRRSRTSYSRPGTVLHDLMETPDDGYDHQHTHQYHDSLYGPKPVLRYTSKQSAYKLDPIVVPSHTCVECNRCNIYQREMESPGPPNTPNTSQYMLDSESPTIRSPFIRGTKLVHISRATSNDFMNDEDYDAFENNYYINSSR